MDRIGLAMPAPLALPVRPSVPSHCSVKRQ